MEIQMERFEAIGTDGKPTGAVMKPGEVHDVHEDQAKKLIKMGAARVPEKEKEEPAAKAKTEKKGG